MTTPADFGASVGTAAATKSDPVLQQLLRAKELSDKKKYEQKQKLLRKLMSENPQLFNVDSTLNSKIVGITHTPSNFRIHVPRAALPGEVSLGQ